MIRFPKDLVNCADNFLENKDHMYVAYSDSLGVRPLNFEKILITERLWKDFQYDLESGQINQPPRDMIFGFVFLDNCPRISKQGQALSAMRRMIDIKFKDQKLFDSDESFPRRPLVEKLRRLHSGDSLTDGMFLVLVRMERPANSKNYVPFSKRPLVQELLAENTPESLKKWAELRDKKDFLKHPTEAKLFLTKNSALVMEVPSFFTCSKCGAVGHHCAISHDDVCSNPKQYRGVSERTHFPPWLEVEPIGAENLGLVEADEDMGVEVTIRQVTTNVPLRLARQLKLMGKQVDGEVHNSGII